MNLYFCIGCKQVHFDNDYCKEDGDLLIENWKKFLENINKIKLSLERGKVNE